MNIKVLLLLTVLTVASCSTKYNQYDARHQRHGKWKETLHTGDGDMLATGKYRNGEKIGKWTYKYGDRLYETEKFKKKHQ